MVVIVVKSRVDLLDYVHVNVGVEASSCSRGYVDGP